MTEVSKGNGPRKVPTFRKGALKNVRFTTQLHVPLDTSGAWKRGRGRGREAQTLIRVSKIANGNLGAYVCVTCRYGDEEPDISPPHLVETKKLNWVNIGRMSLQGNRNKHE